MFFQKLQAYQRINYCPGMMQLTTKHRLCWNLQKLQKVFPQEFHFMPKTWILPSDSNTFKQLFKPNKKVDKGKAYIWKPINDKGTFLTRGIKNIDLDQRT